MLDPFVTLRKKMFITFVEEKKKNRPINFVLFPVNKDTFTNDTSVLQKPKFDFSIKMHANSVRLFQ